MKTVIATMRARKFERSPADAHAFVTFDVYDESGSCMGLGRFTMDVNYTTARESDYWDTVTEEIPEGSGYVWKKLVPKSFRIILDLPDDPPPSAEFVPGRKA